MKYLFLLMLIPAFYSCGTVAYLDKDSLVRRANFNTIYRHQKKCPNKVMRHRVGVDSIGKQFIHFYTCTKTNEFHLLTLPFPPVKKEGRTAGFFYGTYSFKSDTMLLHFKEKPFTSYRPEILSMGSSKQLWLGYENGKSLVLQSR